MHLESNRKRIKHIRKEGKNVLCPVCAKEFTHPHNLKLHIIKTHEQEETAEKGISFEQIVGPVYKGPNQIKMKTSFEEIKEHQALYGKVKVSQEIYSAIVDASVHCPKLHSLMLLGCE